MLRNILAALSFFAIFLSRDALADDGKVLTIDGLVAEALRNNPQLQAARHRTEAATTRIDQATAWKAPEIGFEFYQTPVSSFPNPANNSMENDYFIQQMFPFPGKLSSMGEAAESNARMFDEGYKSLEHKVIRDLKSSYYELYLVQQKIRLNVENQGLMKKFVAIASKRYEVGMGQQQDILRAQTEFSTLINDGLNLQQEKQAAGSMINTILGRSADAQLDSVPEIENDIPDWTFEQLQPIALAHRPEVQAMHYGIEMNKAELSGSKREYYPDIMARVMYKNMTGTRDDFWSTMIGISIPIAPWASGSVTAKVEENEINVKRAEEEYTNMKNMTLFEVQDALVKVRTARNILSLYKTTTIPQAEQTLESTIAAYQTGKTEFLMLIDAYRMLLNVRLDYYMAVMKFMTSQAQLEQAVGLDIAGISQQVQK